MRVLYLSIAHTLLLATFAFGQVGVFSGEEKVGRLTDNTNLEGAWLDVGGYFTNTDGAGILYVSGDSISGTTTLVTVKYQLLFGVYQGDTLKSELFTLGTVAASLQKETFGDGSLIGESFNLADDTEWKQAQMIQFSFSSDTTGTGPQATDLMSIFDVK